MGKGLPGGRSRQAGLTIGSNRGALSSQLDRPRRAPRAARARARPPRRRQCAMMLSRPGAGPTLHRRAPSVAPITPTPLVRGGSLPVNTA
jgi:hypothetical protein